MHDDRSPDGTFVQWAAAASDRDLLAHFVRRSDERAFSEIVRRHSALVLGVCRRVLRDRHAAEDAFQATFLVLARSARSIRRQRSLASWLHSVAYRIARRSLAESHRRKEQAIPMDTVTSKDELHDVGELYEQQLLDEELQELPVKYREPLVLHHLQGLSQQQVAERLGMSVSAVDGRLKRGRKQLKLRLLRRGVEFGTVLAAIGLCQSAVNAASIKPLIALATQSAVAATSGPAIPSTVSPQAASLAGKELTIMSASSKFVTTLGVSAVVVTLIGLAAGNAATVSGVPSRGTAPRISTAVDAFTAEVTANTTPAQADSVESGAVESGNAAQRGAEPVASTEEAGAQEPTEQLRNLSLQLEEFRDELSLELESVRVQLRENAANSQQLTEDLHLTVAELQVRVDRLVSQVEAGGEDNATAETSPLAETGARPVEEAATGLSYRQQSLDYRAATPSIQRIEEALEAQTSIEFPGNPLADVVGYISQIHNIPILLEEQTLLDAGISPDEEISLVITGIRLRSALAIMLENVSGVPLDYVIQDEVMKITTREKVDRILDTRVYNVQQLSSICSSEEIADMLRSNPAWTWSAEDGASETGDRIGTDDAGEIELQVEERFPAMEALPGALVVTQSPRIHREIVDLLEQLHRHNPESATSAIIEAAINDQLDQLTELSFPDRSLLTILQFVSAEYGINIVIDEAALAGSGITGDEEISIVVSGITLRSALSILLSDVGGVELAWFIEDEVIKVTTSAVAAASQIGTSAQNTPVTDDNTEWMTIVYAVPDILWPFGVELPTDPAVKERLARRGYAALITLVSQIDPESWGEDAGTVTRHDETLSLVVRQTGSNHEQISQMLNAVRALTFADNPTEKVKTIFDPAASAVDPALDPATREPSDNVSVSGSIRVQGTVPTLAPLVVAGDLNVRDGSQLDEDVPDESLVVGEENGLANVYVWIKEVPDGTEIPPAPSDPLRIDSQGLRFVPHLLIARTGQQIQLTNADPFVVDVHNRPLQNASINQILPAADSVGVPIEFDQPEAAPIRLTDDIHPLRSGYVLPLDHPFSDITDASGRFEIPQLPPGDYELNIWHERVGYLERGLQVTVPEDGPVEFDLDVAVDQLLSDEPNQ